MSFFGPKILEEVDSKFSGKIKVVSTFGYKYIATGNLTQSGGLVRDVWEPVLVKLAKSYKQKIKSCLILGLAGGTIAGMIAKKFPGAKITGVEIDPLMIALGKKYLDLDKIPNLEIVIKDAKDYLLTTNDHYDCILVDMYLGDQLPAFVYSLSFLKKLKLHSSVVVFNHLIFDEIKRQKAGELVGILKQIFPSVTLTRKLTNLLIICG